MSAETPARGSEANARSRIGHYELFERFAVGDMAELYLGRASGEEGFEKPVAIKRILPRLQDDPRFVQMLQTEARIHASLSHKNIVQIHDLGVSAEGEYFIVLEFVDGRDLAMLLDQYAKGREAGDRRRIDDAIALYIISQLAEGVHFAHELRGTDNKPLGLVHRDISPSNVLLSYAGEIKLSDFGVAKRHMDDSVVKSLKGELAYMSPEQARGGTIDRRSDIFSLGAVAFELFTGTPLRESRGSAEDHVNAASGIVPAAHRHRPDIPSAIDRLLASSLAPDPRDRFPDARAFVDTCQQALATVPRPPHGEATELKNILQSLLPPGAKSPRKQPSKVISLMPSMWEDVTVPESSLLLAPPRTEDVAPPPSAAPLTPTRSERTRSPVPIPPPRAPSQPVPLPPRGNAINSTLFLRKKSKAPWIFGSLMLLSAGLYAFHSFVMPVPVAVAYFQPAFLSVMTDPLGATVSMDGKTTGKTTPVILPITRDRQDHVIEVTLPGHETANFRVRFDQVLEPSVRIPLVPSTPSAPPPPIQAP